MASETLEQLYADHWWDPWAVVQRGERLLAREKDQLAVLEVMRAAVEAIRSDLGEHGAGNRALYDGHDDAHFARLQVDLDRRIAAHVKAGRKSRFFADKVRERKVAYGLHIDELLKRSDRKLKGEEKACHRDLSAAWAAYENQNPPLLVRRALERSLRLTQASPAFVDAVAAHVDRILVEYFVHEQPARLRAARDFVGLFAQLQLKFGRSPHFFEGAVASCIGTANASKDARTAKLALAMVPREVTFRRLAYKLTQFHAGRGDKAAMLRAMRRALELGTDPADLDDDEFDRWRRDKDVKALLAAKIPRRG